MARWTKAQSEEDVGEAKRRASIVVDARASAFSPLLSLPSTFKLVKGYAKRHVFVTYQPVDILYDSLLPSEQNPLEVLGRESFGSVANLDDLGNEAARTEPGEERERARAKRTRGAMGMT